MSEEPASNLPPDSQRLSPMSSSPELDDDLPPVEPPSAGFLVQLFLVPGVIVLVIVAVWALFGRLAAGEQDWQRQLSELRSENEHRRWRAAYGLAQILQNDQELGEDGEKLSLNLKIANTLKEELEKQLDSRKREDADIKNLIFLTRTLGYLDTHGIVLPMLIRVVEDENDREVRKVGIAAIAMVAGRAAERNNPLDNEAVVDTLVDLSSESDELYRQMAAFTMGSLKDDATHQRLLVLLEDNDLPTRVDAATSLARRGKTDGLPVFQNIFTVACQSADERFRKLDKAEEQTARAQEFLMLKNSLQAIDDLSAKWTADEKKQLIALLEPLADDYSESRIRINATKLLNQLRK